MTVLYATFLPPVEHAHGLHAAAMLAGSISHRWPFLAADACVVSPDRLTLFFCLEEITLRFRL